MDKTQLLPLIQDGYETRERCNDYFVGRSAPDKNTILVLLLKKDFRDLPAGFVIIRVDLPFEPWQENLAIIIVIVDGGLLLLWKRSSRARGGREYRANRNLYI